MRTIDTSAYSSEKPSRITPDTIDLGNLPPIEKPVRSTQANNSELPLPVEQAPQTQVERPTSLEGSTVFSKPTLVEQKPESPNSGIENFVASMLNLKNAGKTSFRYPLELLDVLADVERDVRRNRGKKVHMNTIVVVALAYLL